ncbi:phage portal protein [Cupriavidus sp. DL-D2]|uniref:phage portal protein n=1 Tax=Cupriavidus sp. DL-D2 TaxID=3144974 RepID=UPI003213CB56
MKFNLTRVTHGVRAAIDGFVRSFSLTDPELYNRTAAIEAGVEVTPKAVMQLDAVWSCVRLISETIATLPLAMYEKTSAGKRVAPQHSLHFVIHDQPNADSTASVFWEAMVAAMLLRGAGRAEKLYVGEQLVGLAYLDPDKLTCTRDYNTGRKKFTYPRPNGTLREIPESRIWTIPGFTLDGINGVSVIAYGAKVFGNAMAADKAAAQTFKSGLLQTVYYKMAAFLNPKQRAEFKANLLGSVERGETPLLEGGTSVESVGIKPADAQLLESRGYSVEAICRWFRVPPWMVGHTEKSTSWGTGIEQQMIGFLTFTLAPWLKRIEQAISKDLLRPAERVRYYPKFSVEGLLRADSAARAAFYAAMVNNGILTRDEVRELEDREPMGGNAAVLTVQSAMTTLDGLGTADASDANNARAAIRAFLGFEDDQKRD